MAIGVAVSDTPVGPFRDAIGKPLFENGSWDHIDPTVFIDDDGQAWLMWGNPQCYYLKLNRDMISYSGELGRLDMTEEAFGGPMMNKREKGKKYKDSYVEGPWLTKRNGTYQLLYAAGGVPEHISYSTAPHPTGPWKYAGEIMPLSETNSFTNHCGVADYKGHSYFFYHTGKLPRGGGFGRSVAVEEFKYNADGSFPTILPTDEGVKPIETFNPYRKVEAETMAFSRGLKTEQNDEVGVYVSDIHNGDYIKLQNVDFSQNEPTQFVARVASGLRGGQIELHIDSLKGELLARLEVPGTGGWERWQELTAPIQNSNFKTQNEAGKGRDLYLVFTGRKGPKLFNFDWWSITPKHKRLVVEDGGMGAYKAIMKEEESLPAHTIFVPQDLSAFGKKNPLPVLVWGNGACTNSPWEHFKFLNEIASHGYLVLATGYIPMEEKPYQGPMSTTEQQIESIDWAIAQNADPASPYYNKVDVRNICVAGMSCGGLQSLYNCADPRIKTMMICEQSRTSSRRHADARQIKAEGDSLQHHLHPWRQGGHRLRKRHGRLPPDTACTLLCSELSRRSWRHISSATWWRVYGSSVELAELAAERRQAVGQDVQRQELRPLEARRLDHREERQVRQPEVAEASSGGKNSTTEQQPTHTTVKQQPSPNE